MTTLTARPAYFRRQIALPQDHGSWVFLLSPLLIGLFTADQISFASIILVFATLAGFLIRQPITLLIKISSGRRNKRDRPAALFWTLVYTLVGGLAVLALVLLGYTVILVLAVPGILVFAWHLYLVSQRNERRQIGVEIVASGVLALAAPAAYWIGMNGYESAGWWLFFLSWFQSAASIVYAYLRLEQRTLLAIPDTSVRFRLGQRAILYTSFNFFGVLIFALLGILPTLLPVPFALQWLETIWGTMNPAIGVKPTRIGMRQLIVSSLFTLLFILTWNFSI